MANQLWTSPITGYRRIGTRLSELRGLFENAITVKAICEPLKACLLNAPAKEMQALLGERGFDLAGAVDEECRRIVGFVRADALESGYVKDHVKSITADLLIADTTPIADLFLILRKHAQKFVLSGQMVVGIVTRADLNKPPVRIYIFGLISLLEMHMNYWISVYYPAGKWKSALTPNRHEYAAKLFEERRKLGQELDLLECIQFCDKRDILINTQEILELLKVESRDVARHILNSCGRLRDLLAHSQKDLTEGSAWVEIIDIVEWTEKLLGGSDAAIENAAMLVAGKYSEKLR